MENEIVEIYDKTSQFGFKKMVMLVCCLALPIGIGMVAAYFTKDNMMVFDYIKKPALTPPSIVFPIAWTILYILMGLASFLVLIECKGIHETIYIMHPYVIQLILNFAWSIFFFNYQRYDLAFICLVFLWIMILRTMMFFGTINPVTYYFLTPYLLWVTFAGYLNVSIVVLNPR